MFKLFAVSCLIVAAFAEPAIVESGIPVVRTVVQQPGTVSVQKHTIESQHVHGIPTSVSSQRETIVQKSVSHVTPTVVGSATVLRTPSIVGTQGVIGTPSLISSPAVVQSYHSPVLVSHL